MIRTWTLARLEPVEDRPRVLIRDPLRLLPEADGAIHAFARDHGFTVIVAGTNLAFRDLYERATEDPGTKKLLVIDRAPARRRAEPSVTKAPPPFYPDLLDETPEECRIDLDLRQYLRETTGDSTWPQEANDPLYARLIIRHLDGVLRAYQNLRTAQPGRFSDHDFKKLVAYAALGVSEAAFKKLNAQEYWRIGLLGHQALQELDAIAPEITRPIREELKKAPPPFCYFATHDPETVIRAFYLSVVLAQHTENWSLLLASLDPALKPLADIAPEILSEAAPKLIALDREQADRDLESVERDLSREMLQFLLVDQWKIDSPTACVAVIEREQYSSLIRSLALLLAVDNLVSSKPARGEQAKIAAILFPEDANEGIRFADTRKSVAWSHLKEAYRLASKVQALREELSSVVRNLMVVSADQFSLMLFRETWNGKELNRLEYYLSSLERLIESGDFLPRNENDLPAVFGNGLERIRQRVRAIADEVQRHLDDFNRRFQEMIAAQYPTWIRSDTETVLTCQFLRRCLKPHWDPQREKAVILIFDGMRYDIWDELLRPMMMDRLEIVADLPAVSLLPSETHITRKAISAGVPPDEFDSRASEDKLLKNGLAREFGLSGHVEVVSPSGAGTGETVRYRAGDLDVYIFDLCDTELHKIQTRTLPNGRVVSSRPLAFIYQQHIKNIIDTEVMAIVRTLAPGIKVFVVADHGFNRIARERLNMEAAWLNEPTDCAYLNARLRKSLDEVGAPSKVKSNVWEFPVSDLRMPKAEDATDRATKQAWQKQFATIAFPKIGYALARPKANFNPDAYTHGGISIQELLIPMVVLRVKPVDEGLMTVGGITGPSEAVEGEEIEFRLHLASAARVAERGGELRVDVDAVYSRDPDKHPLPPQALYVAAQGVDVVYRFRPDSSDATDEERRAGTMERVLTITVSYRDGRRVHRKSRTHCLIVHLNSEQVIRRIPAHLGSILGLVPRTMR
jgi:hypothetical protein